MKAKYILQEVKKTYSAIAHEFDGTRDRPWPDFEVFLAKLKKQGSRNFAQQNKQGSVKKLKLLDVGCGNGRLSHFLKKEPIEYIGIDNNRTMLRIAKKKNPQAKFRYGDVCKLPFPARSFDTVWSIAVLHHLPNKTLQLKALREIKRVLIRGGSLMLTVWNLWQPKYRKLIDRKTHTAFIPWGGKVLRYYHAFQATELRALLKRARFSSIKKIRSMNNIAYIAYNEKS